MNKRGCISCFLLSPSSRKVLSRLSASFKDRRETRALQARSDGAWCPLLQAGTGPRPVAPWGDCGPWGKDLGLYCWLCHCPVACVTYLLHPRWFSSTGDISSGGAQWQPQHVRRGTAICLGEGQSRSHHFGTNLLPCSSLNPTVREAGRGQIKTGIKPGRLNTLP